MSDINSRLKQLRKTYLKITQNEFGDKIGIKGTTISDIEKGKGNLTERNLTLICEKFNINENWLRTGDESNGIFKPVPIKSSEDEVELLSKKYNLDNFGKAMLSKFVQLDQDDRKGLINYIKALIPAFAELEEAKANENKPPILVVPARGGSYTAELTPELEEALDKDIQLNYEPTDDDF